jgi:hypothetical protein
MMLEGSSVPFIMYIPGFSGFLTSRFFTSEKDWKSSIIFNTPPSEIKSLQIDYPQNTSSSFLLRNNNGKPELLSNSGQIITDFDPMKAKEVFSRFGFVGYEAVLDYFPKQKVDSIVKTTPFCIIKHTNSANISKEIKIWKRKNNDQSMQYDGTLLEYDPDRMFAQIDNSAELFSVQYFVFDPLFKDINFFKKNP